MAMTHLITCPPVRVDQLPVGVTKLLVHRELLGLENHPLLESPFTMATPVKEDSEYDLKEQVRLLWEQMKKFQESVEETNSELKQQAENDAKNHEEELAAAAKRHKEQMDIAAMNYEAEKLAATQRHKEQMDRAAENHREEEAAAAIYEADKQDQADMAWLTSATDALFVKVEGLETELKTMREYVDATVLSLREQFQINVPPARNVRKPRHYRHHH